MPTRWYSLVVRASVHRAEYLGSNLVQSSQRKYVAYSKLYSHPPAWQSALKVRMCCSVLTPLYGREVAACLNDPNITLRFPGHGNTVNKSVKLKTNMVEFRNCMVNFVSAGSRFSKVQQVNWIGIKLSCSLTYYCCHRTLVSINEWLCFTFTHSFSYVSTGFHLPSHVVK